MATLTQTVQTSIILQAQQADIAAQVATQFASQPSEEQLAAVMRQCAARGLQSSATTVTLSRCAQVVTMRGARTDPDSNAPDAGLHAAGYAQRARLEDIHEDEPAAHKIPMNVAREDAQPRRAVLAEASHASGDGQLRQCRN